MAIVIDGKVIKPDPTPKEIKALEAKAKEKAEKKGK